MKYRRKERKLEAWECNLKNKLLIVGAMGDLFIKETKLGLEYKGDAKTVRLCRWGEFYITENGRPIAISRSVFENEYEEDR